jgi:transcriptional regulator with XRE-family HTH domain
MATQTGRTAEIGREVAILVLAAMGEAEMSKSRLAEATGIPYSTLNRKLMGRSEFTFEELFMIAQATDTRPSAFVPSAFEAAVA